MMKLIATLVVSSLVLFPAGARPQSQSDDWVYEPAPGQPQEAAPSTQAPSEAPPAPPAETPAPPPQAQPAPAPAPSASGQWIYTEQYGWIWMPYADRYTYVPPDGYGEPFAYVYYPVYSAWVWLAAPWVWGFGPWPFFGVFGPRHFAWWGHGWWRTPGRWNYAPAFYGGRSRGWPWPVYSGHGGVRPAPAPFRGGVRGAPAPYRGGVRGGPAPYRSGGGWRAAPMRGGSAFFGGARGSGWSGARVAPRGGGFAGRGGGGFSGHAARGGGGGGFGGHHR